METGTLYLKDWIRHEGISYLAVRGYLRLLTDQEHFGFKVRGTESNWGVEVASADRSRVMIVLGCQVRAVQTHEVDERSQITDTMVLA